MGKVVSRFVKNKPLELDDLVSTGVAADLLYTNPKVLNASVDSGLIPVINCDNRTRWNGEKGKWRVFKVSHLLTLAAVRGTPIDDSMLARNIRILKDVQSKYFRVLCYGYPLGFTFPGHFDYCTLREIFRMLERCPLSPVLISDDIDASGAIGLAEELRTAYCPFDLNIWRHKDPADNEWGHPEDFKLFNHVFDSIADAYDHFVKNKE